MPRRNNKHAHLHVRLVVGQGIVLRFIGTARAHGYIRVGHHRAVHPALAPHALRHVAVRVGEDVHGRRLRLHRDHIAAAGVHVVVHADRQRRRHYSHQRLPSKRPTHKRHLIRHNDHVLYSPVSPSKTRGEPRFSRPTRCITGTLQLLLEDRIHR